MEHGTKQQEIYWKYITGGFAESEENIKEYLRQYISEDLNTPISDISILFGVSKQKVAIIKHWMLVKKGERNHSKKNEINPQKIKINPKKARDLIKKESFKNSKGDKKELARNAMIEAIMSSGLDTGKVLSLPFHECLIERKMGRNRFEYIGCERERDVYFEMLKTIGEHKLNITPYLGSIQDKLIIAEKNEYSHLILDYCGQISTFQDEIELAIMNNIVKVNGTISVTLCKRGSIDGKIGEKMNSISESFYQTDCLHTMSVKLFFSQFAGENYKIETFMEYKDSMPMVLIILKRIK